MKKNNSKKIRVIKFFDKKNIGTLPRILVSSFLILFFFYSAPLVISFANKDSNSIQNNSKAVLAYTLNQKSNGLEDEDLILNENDLKQLLYTIDLKDDVIVRSNNLVLSIMTRVAFKVFLRTYFTSKYAS